MDALLVRYVSALTPEERQRLLTLCPILTSAAVLGELERAVRKAQDDGVDRHIRSQLDAAFADACAAVAPVPVPDGLVDIRGCDAIVGSPDGEDDEAPERTVHVPAFRIGKRPVTNADYARFLEATEYPVSEIRMSLVVDGPDDTADYEALADLLAPPPRGFTPDLAEDRPDHPVVEVSWYDAVEYCRWVGGRLPTAYEWERAARSGDRRSWPWGDVADLARCNVAESGVEATTPVDAHPTGVSPDGCLDLTGNAMEWTATPVPVADDPVPDYVIKGGCWAFPFEAAKAWKRHTNPPGDLWDALGFRCAADAVDRADSTQSDQRMGDVPLRHGSVGETNQVLRLIADELVLPIPGASHLNPMLQAATAACIAAAEAAGDAPLLLRARCLEARRLAAYGSPDEAITLAESCAEQARKDDDRGSLGALLLVIGKARCQRNRSIGDHLLDAGPAETSLLEAIEVLEAAGLEDSALEALIWLSSAQRLLSRPESALQTARVALSRSAACRDGLKEGRALLTLGSAFQSIHQSALAAYCHGLAFERGSRFGNATLAAEADAEFLLGLSLTDPAGLCDVAPDILESLALLAPAYLDRAVHVITDGRGSSPFSWALGNLVLAALGADDVAARQALLRTTVAVAQGQQDIVDDAMSALTEIDPGDTSVVTVLVDAVRGVARGRRVPTAAIDDLERATARAEVVAPQMRTVVGLLHVEVLATAGRWTAALDRLAELRGAIKELNSPDITAVYLDFDARLRFYAGDVGGALDACDITSLDVSRRDPTPYSSLALGQAHLLRARILAAVGGGKSFAETEAARWSMLATGDRLRVAEQLICQAQVVFQTLDQHAILANRAVEQLQQAWSIMFGGQLGRTDERLTCELLYAMATSYRIAAAGDRGRELLDEAAARAAAIDHDDVVTACAVDRFELALDDPDPDPDPDTVGVAEIQQVLDVVVPRNRPLELVRAYRVAARAYRRLGDTAAALGLLQRAAELYDAVRRSIRNVNLAKDWLRHERPLMSDIVSCYLAMPGGRQQALAVARATKAAAFRDLVRESVVFASDWPPEEAEEATALWRTIRELNIALENNAGMIGDEVADYEARVTLNERRRELAALAERRMPDPPPADPRAQTAVMWERLGPAAAGTALLEFFLTDDGTSVFVSFPGATGDTVLQLPEVRYGDVTAAVEDGLDDVRATLSAEERDRDPGGMMRALRWLFRSIFRTPDTMGVSLARLLADHQVRRLILVPSGPLAAFPLHALHEERAGSICALIDDFESVSYAAAVDLVPDHPDGGYEPSSCVAVQDPDRSLRYADTEIRLIISAVPSLRILAHEQATKDAVLSASAPASLIHIACHSRFVTSSPYESGLLLHDGLLSLSEIYLTSDFRRAHLVTVSGCEAVRLDPQYGDEFLNLASGFSYAGASAVVGALWDVEDLSTMLLMHRFYDRYAVGTPAGDALAGAQRWLRDVSAHELAGLFDRLPFSATAVASAARRKFQALAPDVRPFRHPAYWAPFTYTGV